MNGRGIGKVANAILVSFAAALALTTQTVQAAQPEPDAPYRTLQQQAQDRDNAWARSLAAFDAMVAKQADELTAGKTCWRDYRTIPAGEHLSTMLVRNAKPGIGPYRGNVGVVRVVPFRQGWDDVARGYVAWVASCR